MISPVPVMAYLVIYEGNHSALPLKLHIPVVPTPYFNNYRFVVLYNINIIKKVKCNQSLDCIYSINIKSVYYIQNIALLRRGDIHIVPTYNNIVIYLLLYTYNNSIII